ncbi:hypothetical protein CDAR_396431 [Caerostris darwini]|uniref:DNA-directed DNA polymerase n=1 Tax=Caerostris darwini TaxID=1538125 RepID=A0AAV4SWJ6_9ARAC|nr:hypothetical protein CDAR_396431 [Caerostris darwini]
MKSLIIIPENMLQHSVAEVKIMDDSDKKLDHKMGWLDHKNFYPSLLSITKKFTCKTMNWTIWQEKTGNKRKYLKSGREPKVQYGWCDEIYLQDQKKKHYKKIEAPYKQVLTM